MKSLSPYPGFRDPPIATVCDCRTRSTLGYPPPFRKLRGTREPMTQIHLWLRINTETEDAVSVYERKTIFPDGKAIRRNQHPFKILPHPGLKRNSIPNAPACTRVIG